MNKLPTFSSEESYRQTNVFSYYGPYGEAYVDAKLYPIVTSTYKRRFLEGGPYGKAKEITRPYHMVTFNKMFVDH